MACVDQVPGACDAAGVTFFEGPSRFEPEPSVEPRPPVWLGPPDNVLGRAVSMEPLVFRSDAAAVLIDRFVVYPTGVEFQVDVRVRVAEHDLWPLDWPHRRSREDPDEGLPDDLLRLGVIFADQRKATTLDRMNPHGEDEPSGPLLWQHSGGGGGHRWEQSMWLWPLPPLGPLVVVVEWPARGLVETRAQRDAGLLVEAAAQAVELWPDERSDPPAGEGAFAT
jgi:hypothetical protein